MKQKPKHYSFLQSLRIIHTLAAAGITSPVIAATWSGNTDVNLSTATNWAAGSGPAPVSGENWVFGTAGSAGATLTNDLATSSAFEVAGITFGSTASAYTITGGAFSLTGNIVNTGGAGNQTIGSNITISGSRGIQLNAGGTVAGNITISGNLLGSGTLTQTAGNGGARSVSFSGDNSGFTGSFIQNNDTNNRTAFSTASAGSASAAWTFNRNVNGGVALGFTNSKISFGSLSGGGFIRANNTGTVTVEVGALNTDTSFGGQFQQSNGTTLLALSKTGTGTFTMTAGSTHTAGTSILSGTIAATNNTAFGTGTITIGNTSGSSNAGISLNVGTNTVANNIVIAAGSSGVASITATNGGSTNTDLSGTVTYNKNFVINAWGAAGSGGNINFNGAISGTGNITIDGNNSIYSPIARFQNSGNSINGDVFIRNGGQLRTVNGALGASNVVNIDSTSQLNTNAQSLTIAGLVGSGTVVASNSTSQTLTLAGSGNYSYSGVISNGANLTKSGTGTQTLSGANTYTGATNVNDGVLVVNGSLANTSTTIAGGAILAGSGSIGGATTISGSLRPGNSIGTMTVGNDVTWNSGDDWVFELGSSAATLALAGAGTSIQDMLNITGVSDFLRGTGADGSFVFDFAGTGATGYYKLVDWDGATDFTSTAFSASNLSSGLTGTFIVDSGTSALYLNVIPEPRAALLGGLGLLALLRRRRD